MPSTEPQRNRLIASLPRDVMDRWLERLQPAQLKLGQLLHESAAALSYVDFPTTSWRFSS